MNQTREAGAYSGLTLPQATARPGNEQAIVSLSDPTLVAHDNLQLAVRPNFGTSGWTIRLRANFFAVEFFHQTIYRYKIEMDMKRLQDTTKRQVLTLLKDAMEFTTNYDGKRRSFFDGLDYVYLTQPLAAEQKAKFLILRNRHGEVSTLEVQFKEVKALSLINRNVHGHQDSMAKAMDVIVRETMSLSYETLGRTFFTSFGNNARYGGRGIELRSGYHQAITPAAQWKPLMNVDVAEGVFHKTQECLKLYCDVLEIEEGHLCNMVEPTPAQRARFLRKIVGLKVKCTHGVRRTYRVRGVTNQSASRIQFPVVLHTGDVKLVTVEEYFEMKYDFKLRYPFLSCLQVGTNERQAYLPIEVCTIAEKQKYRVKSTGPDVILRETAAPCDREREILTLVGTIQSSNHQLRAAIKYQVNGEMEQVNGRVLPAPILQYHATSDKATPSRGSWDVKDKKFHSGICTEKWGITCFVNKEWCSAEDLQLFIESLQQTSEKNGMPILNEPLFREYVLSGEIRDLFRYLCKIHEGLELIVVVLPPKSSLYSEVKRVGDTLLGIATQCVQVKNVVTISLQVIRGLCQKINVKRGGINHILEPSDRPWIFSEPIIFFGASVLHSCFEIERKPSIAAVVASKDAHPSSYSFSVRTQVHGEDTIRDLAEMVREGLLKFYQQTGYKPWRIIMYRDEVPDNRHQKLLVTELLAIRQACTSLETDYKPGITYIVVQKRHHTRFFWSNGADSSRNIPAGTTVDNGICHPTKFDFYLCSHAGIQGTSRPSYYRVLWDDNDLSADVVQKLCYQLCHTYVRCTKSISKPAMVYYARLLASRVHTHLFDKDRASEGNSNQHDREDEYQAFSAAYQNISCDMFYV